MPGNYWIKLYLDILEDSKMATLSDRLWRRIVELFLLAGRYNKDGNLPETDFLAWDLRLEPEELAQDLASIEAIGIIQKVEAGWLVVSYAKRQAPVPHAERQSSYRQRLHKDQYAEQGHGPDPNSIVIEGKITALEPDPNIHRLGFRPLIIELYENLCGKVPPLLMDELMAIAPVYTEAQLRFAFQEAADHNAKNWAYVKKVLENKKNRSGDNGRSKRRDPDPSRYESQDRSDLTGIFAPAMVPPALEQARMNWHKAVVVAENKGLTSLVDPLIPPTDADWRLIEERTAQLRSEIRKASQ